MIEQHERLYRLDKPIVTQDEATAAGIPKPILPPGWIGLDDCNVSPVPGQPIAVTHVLMHPAVGVALIDVAPAESVGAEPAFRARLEAARFAAIFPGHLPIVHLQVEPPELRALGALLPPAFAGLPPLSVPGGDGWVSVVRRALIRRDPTRAAPYSAIHEAPPERSLPAAGRPKMLNRDIGAQRLGATPAPDIDTPIRKSPTGRPPWVWAGVAVAVLIVSAAGAVLLRGAGPAGTPVAATQSPAAVAGAPPPVAAAERPAPVAPPVVPPLPGAATAPAASAVPPARAVPPAPAPARPPAPPPQVAAAATPTPAAPASGPRVVVKSAANLRTTPDNKGAILRTIPAGQVLREFDRAFGGWVQVGDSKPLGWIHSKLLGPAKP